MLPLKPYVCGVGVRNQGSRIRVDVRDEGMSPLKLYRCGNGVSIRGPGLGLSLGTRAAEITFCGVGVRYKVSGVRVGLRDKGRARCR